MRHYLKSELAQTAGVSYKTFQRWLLRNHDHLLNLGLRPNDRLVPPRALSYICYEYGIDKSDLPK